VTVTIAQKAGENDQLFGSVTSKDVVDALAQKNFSIDRRNRAAHCQARSANYPTISDSSRATVSVNRWSI
jgi:ribosomal protein L9